jgi:hypothetical protein
LPPTHFQPADLPPERGGIQGCCCLIVRHTVSQLLQGCDDSELASG